MTLVIYKNYTEMHGQPNIKNGLQKEKMKKFLYSLQ